MIGGLQPCSFIDFPGSLSAVVFLCGCNLRCPYCHNPGLLHASTSSSMGMDDLLWFLSSRRGRLEGVVVSGGEPTLQPRLGTLLEAIRALGFRVKLDTNGTRPEILSELVGRGLVDMVAMDLKDEPEAYRDWLGAVDPGAIRSSIELLMRSGIDHELRTTVVLPYHDIDRLQRMAGVAVGAKRWVLQPYRAKGAILSPPGFQAPTSWQLTELAERLRGSCGVNCVSRGGNQCERPGVSGVQDGRAGLQPADRR